MNRLNFSLPEFTRIIWASEKARFTWKPRVEMINAAWPIIERMTVVNGLRSGGLQSITPDKLIAFQHWCREYNQNFTILSQEGSSPVYGNATQPYDPERPWTYRVYFGMAAKDFAEFWKQQSDRQIANFLGYPLCCAEFFHKYWKTDGWRDLTYPMTNFESRVVEGPPMCNILLRQLGIRLVFHLPCSFTCDETSKLGIQILGQMQDLGFKREAEWLYEILNWPVRWSSLHGVAMITTPCVNIITSTDALPEVVTIDHPGSEYPEDGATGSSFPFRKPAQIIKIQTKDNWTDNGFRDKASMRAAHDLILRVTERTLLEPGFVLDLGCGNGLLLDKLQERYPFLEPTGVEIDAERVARARLRHSGSIYETDILDVDTYLGNYQLILISLNRVKEAGHESVGLFLSRLKTCTRYLLVYSYDAWDEEAAAILYENFVEAYADRNSNTEARIFIPKI